MTRSFFCFLKGGHKKMLLKILSRPVLTNPFCELALFLLQKTKKTAFLSPKNASNQNVNKSLCYGHTGAEASCFSRNVKYCLLSVLK